MITDNGRSVPSVEAALDEGYELTRPGRMGNAGYETGGSGGMGSAAYPDGRTEGTLEDGHGNKGSHTCKER